MLAERHRSRATARKTTLNLTEDARLRLKALAATRGVSMSKAVEDLLEESLLTISIPIPHDLLDELLKRSTANGRSVSAETVEVLTSALH